MCPSVPYDMAAPPVGYRRPDVVRCQKAEVHVHASDAKEFKYSGILLYRRSDGHVRFVVLRML